LAVAQRDVLNAETEIRRILGSQDAFLSDAPELVPVEVPVMAPNQLQLENVINEAMQQRSEVKQSLQRARVAAIQYNISQSDMRPELNMIFNSYVSALRGETDIPGAWSDQFQNSTPGFAAGFEFNMPYGRRAARARMTRQQLVVEQVRHEIDQAMHLVIADAKTAWRRVDSAYQTTLAAGVAIDAALADLLQNEARWESFALIEGDLAEGQTPTTLLDQLLDAQQRLANAELTWSQAMLEYKVAEINLKRAMGTLLVYYQQPVLAGQ
jgi:outer membrane protein TolC